MRTSESIQQREAFIYVNLGRSVAAFISFKALAYNRLYIIAIEDVSTKLTAREFGATKVV